MLATALNGRRADWEAAAISNQRPLEYAARISPDGRWMAYTSDESGQPEVYVQRFPPGGERTLISDRGGMEPQWRRDGRLLLYLAGRDPKLVMPAPARGPARGGSDLNQPV